ncbi:MAG: hypothetical protein H6Q17_1377 [Bacteroidetes bacterium]|jgi:hypothetical protein|nr:hypothetical protein [Bacteroidota bacterium]
MRHIWVILIIESLLCGTIHAGNLSREEFSLKTLFGKLYQAPSDSLRSLLNDSICQQLNVSLQNDSSFEYAFDSLPYLGKVYSTDRKLRIYSWNYISTDGDYRFFSYFQFASHKLVYLAQDRSGYLPENDRTINAKNWYGALYYTAIPVSYQNEVHYILLGWSHYSSDLNFKVMDVLSIKENTLTFGLPLFIQNNQSSYRVTLPYSSGHTLALQYDPKRNILIFSHLNNNSTKENRIPDESFSGFQLTSDKLIYKDEVTFDHHEITTPRTKVEYGLERKK